MSGSLAPGDRLDRYELICPMAQGGMASVWVARLQGKHGFEKLVAIKTILPEYASDSRFRAMFLDEARILSQVQHVNVAQILDMGEAGDVLYLVMEFVDGDALSKLLGRIDKKQIPVPAGVLLRILADTCLGLHAAHELRDRATGALLGVVHRDVSPHNVLIAQQGTAKLIDFGIAKASGRLAQDTGADGLKGKIAYMAPEQAAAGAKNIDRRADIWAIGAIIYAAYTGKTPYEGSSEIDTLRALVAGRDPDPLHADVPLPLREIALRATRSRADERYSTALELARALESAIGEIGEPTHPADVAAFLSATLPDRAAARRNALDFALKAAEDRERVRGLLGGPSSLQVASDALFAANDRLMKTDLEDSDPNVTAPATPPTLPLTGGTRAYEDPALAPPNAPSRSPAHASEPPMPYAATKASGGPPLHRAAPVVPELDLPVEPPRPLTPLPPPPAEHAASRPLSTPPPPRIASAAGGIVGPDVLPGLDRSPRDEFIDPAAIAANRVPPRSDAPPASSKTYDMLSNRPTSRAIVGDMKGALREAKAEAASRRAARRRKILFGAGIFVVALLGLGALTPWWAKSRVLAAAQEQHFSLTASRVTVGLGSVHLYDVKIAPADLHVTAKAPELEIETSWLDADAITVSNPEVTVDGTVDDVFAAAEQLRARVASAAPKARKVSLHDGRVSWNAPLGAGSRFDAEGVSVDLTRGASGLGDEARVTSASTRLLTTRGLVGPWRVDAERGPRNARVRIGFDPVLPDGPSAILVRTENGTTATVRIARQPLGRLGIPFGLVGLAPDDNTQLEAQMQLTRPLPNRVSGDARITVYDARIVAQAPPMNLVLGGDFAGEPGKPLDVSHAQLSFGPLTARVVGAVTLFDDAFKVDLNWRVPPLPCGVLLRKQAPATASAEGMLVFDLRRPDNATFTVTQAQTCGLSIFPR